MCPITKSAKKALRQSKRRRQRNLRQLSAMREIIKKIRKLVDENKKAAEGEPRQGREEALKLLPQAYKVIDKAAKTGIIKKNNAARKKSRLIKLIIKPAPETTPKQ